MTVAIKCGVQYLRFHIYSPRIALHCCDKAWKQGCIIAHLSSLHCSALYNCIVSTYCRRTI